MVKVGVIREIDLHTIDETFEGGEDREASAKKY
jgi:hypothetical protein